MLLSSFFTSLSSQLRDVKVSAAYKASDLNCALLIYVSHAASLTDGCVHYGAVHDSELNQQGDKGEY